MAPSGLGSKRPLDAGDEEAKRSRAAEDEDLDALLAGAAKDDDFDALMGGALDLQDFTGPPPAEPPDEVARREFAERLTGSRHVSETDLPGLLAVLRDEAPRWTPLRRWRSVALLAACVARSPRACRAAFVAEGLPVLGSLLLECVGSLEDGTATERQEGGMWALACLSTLRALSLGRSTLWEHRHSLGKPFDRLHKWCSRERSALAAELRGPTQALCQRWRRQPKPAGQEASPQQKALRSRVIEMVVQGLLGISGGNSPASPAITAPSPAGGAMPAKLVAAEVEAALFGRHGGAPNAEYKAHARMLRANLALAGNARLRERVLSGEIGAEELVKMDSASLAPDSLQEQRRLQEQQHMKEVVVQDMMPRLGSKSFDKPASDRDARDWNIAPPVWAKVKSASAEDLSAKGSSDKLDAEPEKEVVAAPVQAMEPPPTPFRDMSNTAGGGHASEAHADLAPATPDFFATPAPDDEDEEQEALIHYLAKPVST